MTRGPRGIRIEWSRYNNGIAAGQIIWDGRHVERRTRKAGYFLANFMGNEGYNGTVYGDQWL